MIEGVHVQPLRQIGDDRGMVLHMLRKDSRYFESFGEIYFSIVNPGSIKAWKRHHQMTQNYAVPIGMIRLALLDRRPKSPTEGKMETLEVGQRNYQLVQIPPGVWYGFQGISEQPALIANLTNLPFDENEVERVPIEQIPYPWEMPRVSC